MSNATRFISAYNKLDKAIRHRFNFKASMSFTDVVRRAAAQNAIVRKFEDEILDYGRLRNAIVHTSNAQMIIAEPHDDVADNFEHIARLIAEPPKASSISKKAVTVPWNERLKGAMAKMSAGNYSNLPVLKDNKIIGVLSNKSLVEYLAKNMRTESIDALLDSALVTDALTFDDRYYMFLPYASCGVDEILNVFTMSRKLRIVMLTKDGGAGGEPLGVLTAGDIIDIKIDIL